MAEKVEFVFVLFFECSEDLCVDRCLKRGQAGSGRSDDNLESLKKRFVTYVNDTMPIINFYKTLNKVEQIDASPDAETVYNKVREALLKARENKLF
jgi:UMP-CMP kinase